MDVFIIRITATLEKPSDASLLFSMDTRIDNWKLKRRCRLIWQQISLHDAAIFLQAESLQLVVRPTIPDRQILHVLELELAKVHHVPVSLIPTQVYDNIFSFLPCIPHMRKEEAGMVPFPERAIDKVQRLG